MTLTTTRYVHPFDHVPDAPEDELRRLLGGKGLGLVEMAGRLALPVPPGFTITTEACRAYLHGAWPPGLDEEVRSGLVDLAKRLGRSFGDPDNPLLVSVRSGAPVSMPGMMDTVLNVGLNDATAAGLARLSGVDFAADCLRRFRESYQTVIGTDPPNDPWAQVRGAIEAVFRSWNSERARAYRSREGIADDLGTAVTVQAMVFGNGGESSGTGVLFTRNPSTGENVPYGDVMFDAQGDDVVAGTHATEPIAVLDTRLPAVAEELRRYARVLEHHLADLADIEFTIEDGRLWLLQVRAGKRSPRAALRIAIDMAEDPSFPLSREQAVRRVSHLLADPPRSFVRAPGAPSPIAMGLPASPGVAWGEVVTSADAAVEASAAGRQVILVRPETSPEDVRGMSASAGVLTARGGLASHAAVVARGWGIPAVVGAGANIDRFTPGERISIDGTTGEVFRGELAGEWEVAPEAATLLEWARDLAIDVAESSTDSSPGPSDQSVASGRDDLIRALAIKGSIVEADPSIAALVDSRLAEKAAGAYRLTATGKLAAAELFAADRTVVGEARTAELLAEFHALDARMKSIVTAWQVRDVAGEQTLNDHSDSDYDAGVMRDLVALHDDTGAWLAPLGERLGRFGTYSQRLTAALDAAQTGDQRFVASPRVDSYHSVWFELHEDLIRLAGRKRSDEAAAGRA